MLDWMRAISKACGDILPEEAPPQSVQPEPAVEIPKLAPPPAAPVNKRETEMRSPSDADEFPVQEKPNTEKYTSAEAR